jgi:hypothetical protein
MLLSFEILRPQGAFAFVIAWATLLLLIRSGASSPAGVEEHVQTDIWVLQELERSCRLLGNIPAGVTGSSTPGFGGGTRPPRSEHSEYNRGTTKRRKRSAVGWAAGSHSALIVSTKLANGSQPEPVERSEAPDYRTVFEKHDECLEIR